MITLPSSPDSIASTTSARDALEILFTRDLPREHGFEPLEITGAIPGDLVGTLYRNGPVLFELFDRRYSHPFEGDGGVSAVRFGDGGVSGAATVTASAGLADERAAGRMKYSMSAPRWRRLWNTHLARRDKNTANTSVVAWQGRLFALMEAGLPTEIDPESLATLGETDLDGAVRGAFSAHPHRVAGRRETYNFGVRYGRRNYIDFYGLPDEGAARRVGSVEVPFSPMLHDFIATERYLIVFLSPVALSISRFMLARGSFDDLWSWQPERGTEVICVPIDEPDKVARFAVDPFYQWHFANAFDRGGEAVIDFVRYPNFDSFYDLAEPGDGVAPGTLCRARLDPAAETLAIEPVADLAVEFPRVHPAVCGAEHRRVWMAAGDLDRVACWDAETGELESAALPDGWVTSEVLLAPRPGGDGERDGYLLGMVYDAAADRSGVAVWDATRLAEPVATAWFDHRIPITFHGIWVA